MNRCLFCQAPRLHLPLGTSVFFMFCTFVIGVSVVLLASTLSARELTPQRIVCESGAFDSVRSTDDPYLRERATCNINDSNGRPVPVVVID